MPLQVLVLALVLCAPRAQPAELDVHTPAFLALREQARQQELRGEKALLQARIAFLVKEADHFDEQLKAAQARRNVQEMRIATEGAEVFREAAETLRTEGRLEFRETVRAELRSSLDAARSGLASIDQDFESRLSAFREGLRKPFLQAAQRQLGSEAEALDAMEAEAAFQRWLSGEPAPPGPAAARNGDSSLNAQPPPSAPLPEGVEPMAVSGQAKGPWFTVARWSGQMAGADVVTIPVFERADTEVTRHPHIMSGGESVGTYEGVTAIPRDNTYAFRLLAREDQKPVAVLEWPSRRNEYALVVRTGFFPNPPITHGFVLEASLLRGQAEVGRQRQWISIPVQTDPPGASLFINDQPYYDQRLSTLPRTPCTLQLAPGSYTIELRLEDHVPARAEKVDVRDGMRLAWTFRHESELPAKVYTVEADQTGWLATDITVQPRDKLWVWSEGDWFAHAAVGPQTATPAFQQRGAGALLLRIGPDGDRSEREKNTSGSFVSLPIEIDGREAIVARGAGVVYLDINEVEGREARRDNRGSKKVHILYLPGGKAPPDDLRQPRRR